MKTELANHVRHYFELMTAGDIEGIIALFADDGTVVSPFLGTMAARPFFEKLGSASTNSVLTVFNVLIGDDNRTAAGHFRYDWTLVDGSDLMFEGIDLFTFADDQRFQSMNIYYDTHPLRLEIGDKYAKA